MSEARKLGYQHYYSHCGIDDNPFDDGSDECLFWVEGYLEAERDDITTIEFGKTIGYDVTGWLKR